MTHIFKVVSQTQPTTVTKQDGTNIQKSSLFLQDIGSQYADSYACTLLGNNATVTYLPNDLVLASLRFTAREHNGNFYQDILVQDIFRLNDRAF